MTLSSSLTSIGSGAFSYSGLTRVTISSGVTNIGEKVFCGCSELTAIMVEADNTHYLSVDDLLLSKDGMTLIQGVNGDVTIPSSVIHIGDYAFCDFHGLTNVTIPSSVTNIGDYAFAVCGGLTRMTIPDNVTHIGDYAFAICSGLTDVVVGSGVTGIGSGRGRSIVVEVWQT